MQKLTVISHLQKLKKMGNRYLISGAQLGILYALIKLDEFNKTNEKKRKKFAEDILDDIIHQSVWESKEPLQEDLEKVRLIFSI